MLTDFVGKWFAPSSYISTGMGTINYDIAAIFILTINLFLFFSRRRLFSRDTRIFGWLLFVTLGTVLTDIITVVFYEESVFFPLWFLYTINTLYYVLQNSITPLFALFILSLNNHFSLIKRSRQFLFLFPWLCGVLLIFSTPYTKIVFSFNKAHRYSRGFGVSILYYIVILYTSIIIYRLYKDRESFSPKTLFSIGMFMPLFLVPAAIQFFFPKVLVQNLGLALSQLVILITVQDFGNYTDKTSGFYNRSGFVAQFEILMRKRKKSVVFLVSLRFVDFLRQSLGYKAFEELQKQIVNKIAGNTKRNRFVAILGEGRYVLVLSEHLNIERERDFLIDAFRTSWNVVDRKITVSANFCEINIPEDTETIQNIFQADYKLSNTKWKNRKYTILSLKDLSLDDTKRKHYISQSIKNALNSNGFEVYYQPIISLSTGKVVSAEGLLRLYDSDLDWISPYEFIDIAEQNGTIHRLGEFVFNTACAFLAELRAAGYDFSYFEINLSMAQCLQANLSQRLLTIVRRHNLEPKNICLEITETAANLSPAITKKNLENLASQGFLLAMDDFGTGYSNIEHFMDLPFKMVKLDRSLIVGMENSRKGLVGLEMIVDMFKNMNTEIIAEGIETKSQIELVRNLRVDLIQGYYFARPMPADTFKKFLSERK
ncbi:MAG TPA: GGDEF domain-containing phosphodiesterase [Treponemataceae bacterium]|nr:GGDEF domain-containing phosphodiesterase [Treponemataceae bacterium]